MLGLVVGAPKTVPAGVEIVGEDVSDRDCHLLLGGQAFRHRTLRDGRRQILSFHVPGDLLDLEALHLKSDFGVCTLTRCRIAAVPKLKLQTLMETRPAVNQAVWRHSLLEAAIAREWMVGMGRRSAHARIAHLLCEVYTRHREAGLATGSSCYFPITQMHLADASGLSSVHTNRVLQALRADGLIAFRGRELVIRDWQGLRLAGEFDPAYLQAPAQAAA